MNCIICNCNTLTTSCSLSASLIPAYKSCRQPEACCALTELQGSDEGRRRAERQVYTDQNQSAKRLPCLPLWPQHIHAWMTGRFKWWYRNHWCLKWQIGSLMCACLCLPPADLTLHSSCPDPNLHLFNSLSPLQWQQNRKTHFLVFGKQMSLHGKCHRTIRCSKKIKCSEFCLEKNKIGACKKDKGRNKRNQSLYSGIITGTSRDQQRVSSIRLSDY